MAQAQDDYQRKRDADWKVLAEDQVAAGLNKQGLKTGAGERFTAASVRWVRYAIGMKSYAQRLKESGMLTSQQMGF